MSNPPQSEFAVARTGDLIALVVRTPERRVVFNMDLATAGRFGFQIKEVAHEILFGNAPPPDNVVIIPRGST